jgi:predicted DNA-binding transcriptional regulator AlpA
MTLQAGDRLMSLTDVSEMLGIPVHSLYRWRSKGDGPLGYRVGRHVRYRPGGRRRLAGAAGR